MVINLDKPFSLGDLSPIQFPHVYISRLIVDGPGQMVSVQYEMGVMSEKDVWTPTPIPTSSVVNMMGADLYPFFFTKPSDLDTSLWDQVERLVYQEIQTLMPRLAGSIGNPISPAEASPSVADAPVTEPTPTSETAAQEPESNITFEAVPDANL